VEGIGRNTIQGTTQAPAWSERGIKYYLQNCLL